MSDACTQCPSNEECCKVTCEKPMSEAKSCWYDHCERICKQAYTENCPLEKKPLNLRDLVATAKTFKEWAEERRKIYIYHHFSKSNGLYMEQLERFEEQKLVSVVGLQQLQEQIAKLDFHLCILCCQVGCKSCVLKELEEVLKNEFCPLPFPQR